LAAGRSYDCLGPYAKVQNCPVEGHDRRYTCYATGYADTAFSVPAVTRIAGRRVKGIFTFNGELPGDIRFVPTKAVEGATAS
jgi:hypothetical protein